MTRILLAVVIVIMFPMSVVAQNCPLPDKASIGDGRQCICDKGILLCLDYEPKDDNHKMGKTGEEMMKLTIELTDEKFKYSLEVGKTTNHGEHPLTPESMVVFTNAVSMCRNAYINQQEEFFREANAKAWIETHPEIKLNGK